MKNYYLFAKDLIGLKDAVPRNLKSNDFTILFGLSDLSQDIDWNVISDEWKINRIVLCNHFDSVEESKSVLRNLKTEASFLSRFGTQNKSLRLYLRNEYAYLLDDYLMLGEALGIEDVKVLADEFKVSADQKVTFHTQQFLYKMLSVSAKERIAKMYYRFLREQLMNGVDLPKALQKEAHLYNGDGFQIQKIPAIDSKWTIPLTYKIHRASLSLSGKLRKRKKQLGRLESSESSKNERTKLNPRNFKRVMITGWYGTETNGDKAIIAEILYFLKACNPNIQFIITTIQEDISAQTNTELELLNKAKLISLNKAPNPSLIRSCDAVIMGGGPLMESVLLSPIAKIFKIADYLGKAKIVFGCGIGPIHTEASRTHIKTIIDLADKGFLRDSSSLDLGKTLVPDLKFEVACDPALAFVRRWYQKNKQHLKRKEGAVACLVRSNTNEFSPDASAQELQRLNQDAANTLASLVNNVPTNAFTSVRMLQMNAPHVGGDDRLFNRLLATAVKDKDKVHLYRNYMDIEEQMKELAQCDYALAMRFHGHIFSMAMEIPFLSIDYTGKGGKVESLVQRINHSNYSVRWSEIDSSNDGVLNTLISNKTQISHNLGKEADKLVRLLHDVYYQVFDIQIEETNY